MMEIVLHIGKEKLPQGIHGISSAEGHHYTILIDSNQRQEEQAAAFLHEMLHIWHGDHESNKSTAEIEEERHEELISILSYLNR